MDRITSITVKLPKALKSKVEEVADRTDTDISRLVRLAIESFLDEVEKNNQIRIPVKRGYVKEPSTRGKKSVSATGTSASPQMAA